MKESQIHTVDFVVPAGETSDQIVVQFPDGYSFASHIALFTSDNATLDHYKLGISEQRDGHPVIRETNSKLFEVGDNIPANHRMFKLPFQIVDKVCTVKTRHAEVPNGEELKFQIAFFIHRSEPENC